MLSSRVRLSVCNRIIQPEESSSCRVDTGVKPPVVVSPLQNVDSSEQGPAKFTAKITGFPEPAATW